MSSAPTWESGAVLKCNTLWRLGMHYNYEFFMVSHTTPSGNVMGWPLRATRTLEECSHDYTTSRWDVDATRPTGRVKRLAKAWSWQLVEPDELATGVRATSCVS